MIEEDFMISINFPPAYCQLLPRVTRPMDHGSPRDVSVSTL